MTQLKYKRVLLKVSGEGLSGTGGFGLDAGELGTMARQIVELRNMSVEVAVVTGAGNFIRGATLCEQAPIGRVSADQMGMLATVINSIALRDVLESQGCAACVLSAREMNSICELFVQQRAIKYLQAGTVVILAGGTGNPLFTTDTCAALRASEIEADVLIKATKVDGVYSADPVKNPNAKFYDKLSYTEVLRDDLRVMDQTAVTMCRDNGIDIIVCNLMKPGTVAQAVMGQKVGTIISR